MPSASAPFVPTFRRLCDALAGSSSSSHDGGNNHNSSSGSSSSSSSKRHARLLDVFFRAASSCTHPPPPTPTQLSLVLESHLYALSLCSPHTARSAAALLARLAPAGLHACPPDLAAVLWILARSADTTHAALATPAATGGGPLRTHLLDHAVQAAGAADAAAEFGGGRRLDRAIFHVAESADLRLDGLQSRPQSTSTPLPLGMHHIDWTSAFSRLPSIFRFPDALPDPAAHHSHDRLFPTFAAAPAAEPDSAAFVETASMQSSQDSAYVSHPAEPNALDASIWESSSAFSAAPPRSLAWEHLPSSVHITDTAFSSPLVTDVPFSINDAAYRSAFQPSDRYVWADPGIVVTDRFVAKCVLKAAVGIPSAIFDLDRTDWRVAVRQDHLSRLRLASLSPSALHSILRDVACLATNHVRIRRVAHLLLDDPEHFGLTGAALASGLTQTMDRFHAYIVHLEDKLERDSLHLLEIGNAFNQPRLVLSALASLFNADSAQPFAHRSIPASLSLLSLLYDAVLRIDYLDDVQLDESGMGGIRHVLLLLLRLASAPFLAWMDAWIGLVGAHASGIDPAALYDPYGEFVGALKGPSQVDGEASSAEQRPALPAFVPSDMAKALFDAGSSLRLISDPENLKQGHFSGVPGSPLASGLHLHSRMSFRMAEIRQIHAAATAYEDAQLAIWDKESAAKVRAERRRAQDRLRQLAENVEKAREMDEQKEAERQEAVLQLQKRRRDLQASIDAFLAQRSAEKETELERQRVLEAAALQRELQEQAMRADLEAQEAEALVRDFERRMRLIEAAEERVVWRQKRLDHSEKRLAVLGETWQPVEEEHAVDGVRVAGNETDNVAETEQDQGSSAGSADLFFDPLESMQSSAHNSSDDRVPRALSSEPQDVEMPVLPSRRSSSAGSIALMQSSSSSSSSSFMDATSQLGDASPPAQPADQVGARDRDSAPDAGMDQQSVSDSSHQSEASVSRQSDQQLGSFAEFASRGCTRDAATSTSFFAIPSSAEASFQSGALLSDASNEDRDGDVLTFTCPVPVAITRSLLHVWKTQIRLVSRAALMLLFADEASRYSRIHDRRTDTSSDALLRHVRSHDLRFHLHLLQSHHCLQDGGFVLAVKDALFRDQPADRDPHVRGLGLNGDARWPPDMNALTRALRSVVDEHGAGMEGRLGDMQLDSLLEFAAHGTHDIPDDLTASNALAFLRLVYRAPRPFDAVITPDTVEVFEAVFGWLLSLVRVDEALSRMHQSRVWDKMRQTSTQRSAAPPSRPSPLSAAGSLTRSEFSLAMQLIHGARVLVKALMWHAFHGVVLGSWTRLTRALDSVARRAFGYRHSASRGSDANSDSDADSGTDSETGHDAQPPGETLLAQSITNIGSLQSAIHQTARRMHRGLFLDHAQRPQRHAIESLLQIVLKFSRRMQGLAVAETLPMLHAAFDVRRSLLMSLLADAPAAGLGVPADGDVDDPSAGSAEMLLAALDPVPSAGQ